MWGVKLQMRREITCAGLVIVLSVGAIAGWRDTLPRPVYEDCPAFVDLYYRAWEIAHDRMGCQPGIPSPRYMDEVFWDDRIWIWDTCFMAHFCKYCPWEFPGIESLENFYGVMLADADAEPILVSGEKCSNMGRGVNLPFLVHHPDNPPLFAWTEYVYALQMGDRSRLEKVFVEKRWLQRWYDLFESFDPEAKPPQGAYRKALIKRYPDGYSWDGNASGMDNTPRGRKGPKDVGKASRCPDNPDLRWVDAYAQQGLAALYMSKIADLLGRADEAAQWRARYEAAKAKINDLYWDKGDSFYYDILGSDRSKVRVMTPASFWPALAEMPDRDMMSAMERYLRDANALGGEIPVVTVARNDLDFNPKGGYWRGGVWLPTTYMTVKALDAYGDHGLAREIALKTLERMQRTYVNYEPHTIWECYSPTADKPSTDKVDTKFARPDFCGWSALGPISLFIEDVIGIKEADAFRNELTCVFPEEVKGVFGVENYRFGRVCCSVKVTAGEILVESNRPFVLVANGIRHEAKDGKNRFERNRQ